LGKLASHRGVVLLGAHQVVVLGRTLELGPVMPLIRSTDVQREVELTVEDVEEILGCLPGVIFAR
jgi:hypothetical protein